jgi:probable HAF family extracellular repeat protein
MSRCTICVALALALLTVALESTQAAPAYRVEYLGFSFLNGLDAAINNHGEIVGRSGSNGILYSGGQITVIESLGAQSGSRPAAINDAGLVGGVSSPATGAPHGFLWDNGSLTDLGALPDFPQSRVHELNEAGDAVGASLIGAGTSSRAVLWRNGTIVDLGWGTANAINEAGTIVGTSEENRAVVYENGAMTDLGNFGDSRLTQAIDINDRGQIVGLSRVRLPSGTFVSHPFLFEAGVWHDLGLPAGVPLGIPIAINNGGELIGNSNGSLGSFDRPPFVYTDGVIYNLQTLIDDSGAGLNLQLVYDINDHGVILAQGGRANSYEAVILIPVPEPATSALASFGLIAFVSFARSKKLRSHPTRRSAPGTRSFRAGYPSTAMIKSASARIERSTCLTPSVPPRARP